MVIRQAINLCVYNAGIYIRIVKPVHWLPKHQYNVLIITIGAALSALFTCVSHLYKNTFFFKFIHYNIVYGNKFFYLNIYDFIATKSRMTYNSRLKKYLFTTTLYALKV